MPLTGSQAALQSMIEAKLKSLPIGNFPVKTTISMSPQEDGTVDPQSDVQSQDVFLDSATAKVIAQAVAEAVVTHLLSVAVITGGGTLGPGKIT
jgi:hypothetical protein